jgi:DivIVA domain-containing protein
MWVWVIVIVALTGGVVAVAVGRGGSMAEAHEDRPDAAVPSGRPLTSDDLRDVRLSTAVRGYRMDEVDALLARIRADMIAREAASAEAASADATPDDAAVDPPAPSEPAVHRAPDPYATPAPEPTSDETSEREPT